MIHNPMTRSPVYLDLPIQSPLQNFKQDIKSSPNSSTTFTRQGSWSPCGPTCLLRVPLRKSRSHFRGASRPNVILCASFPLQNTPIVYGCLDQPSDTRLMPAHLSPVALRTHHVPCLSCSDHHQAERTPYALFSRRRCTADGGGVFADDMCPCGAMASPFHPPPSCISLMAPPRHQY